MDVSLVTDPLYCHLYSMLVHIHSMEGMTPQKWWSYTSLTLKLCPKLMYKNLIRIFEHFVEVFGDYDGLCN